MLKAALYVRYSSDLQNPGSIDDQPRFCRQLAERQGWEIVGLYHDEAVSGASLQIAGAHQRAVLTAPRRFTTQARKLIAMLKESDDTETVLKLLRIIGPVAMTPAAGQLGLRFTLRARRVCEA